MLEPTIILTREKNGNLKVTIDKTELDGLIGYQLIERAGKCSYIEFTVLSPGLYKRDLQELIMQFPITYLKIVWE